LRQPWSQDVLVPGPRPGRPQAGIFFIFLMLQLPPWLGGRQAPCPPRERGQSVVNNYAHKSPPRRGSHRYPAQGTAGRARAAYAAAGKDPVETPSPHAAATRIGRRQASAGVLPLTESNSVLWHPSRNRRLHCVRGTSMSIYQFLILSAPASQPQPQPLSLSLSLLGSASAEAPAGRPAGQPAQT